MDKLTQIRVDDETRHLLVESSTSLGLIIPVDLRSVFVRNRVIEGVGTSSFYFDEEEQGMTTEKELEALYGRTPLQQAQLSLKSTSSKCRPHKNQRCSIPTGCATSFTSTAIRFESILHRFSFSRGWS